MINLKKQFRYDNILKKMIKLEFKENKRFKFPEEYAIYDSDEEKQIIFKNSLDLGVRIKEDEDGIRDLIQQAKWKDDQMKRTEKIMMNKIIKQDIDLEKYLKKMVVKYYKYERSRDAIGVVWSINKFLSEMYAYMKKQHTDSTKRRFPKIPNYGNNKKKSRFNNFPKKLKSYFFNLQQKLHITNEGKLIFARNDNMHFWAPTSNNKCKIHRENCPLYCKFNSHNEVINDQKSKNFDKIFQPRTEINEAERLHLWKRKDQSLKDQKSKIFLCLEEAEHCTFEPQINKKEENISSEDVINKRLSNKIWVDQMGNNFCNRFPLVYKEGIAKKAKIMFKEGNFTDCMKLLESAFEIEEIKAHFDPKFGAIYKKKKDEESRKAREEGKNQNDNFSMFNSEKKKALEKDNFSNPKNKKICEHVFIMVNEMEMYRKSMKKEADKVKQELKVIHQTQKDIKQGKGFSVLDSMVSEMKTNSTKFHTNTNMSGSKAKITLNSNNTMNPIPEENKNNMNITLAPEHLTYLKDRYFKFFKTIMCPLKEACPFSLGPRWPHSDIKANTPFGINCPYAHHISEIKFE